MRFIEGPRAPSDHRKCRECLFRFENQGSNMYPTVVAFAEMVLPSDLHAKSKPSRKCKIPTQYTGLSAIHPQNHPLDSAKSRKKGNPDDPACVHQQRRPGASLELRFSVRMPRMIPTAFQTHSLKGR